ncbi:MAG: PAS domain S-box protein [Deltaproteobacteria bacterium]|nr:PAS domain S-box protein [Deltaproteobacteria bacterium]
MMDLMEACHKSETLLARVVASIQHPLIVADPGGAILYANPAVEKVFGFTARELAGQELSVGFPPEDLDHLYPNLLTLAQKDKPFEEELVLLRKNKTRFFARLLIQPCHDPIQEKSFIIISIHDIDKQKKIEHALKETHYQDLVKVSDGIAHELRNPLAIIGGFLERIYRSSGFPPADVEYYRHINDNLTKMENIVAEVEFFAHLPTPRFAEESVRELIDSSLQAHVDRIEKKKIVLTVFGDDFRLFIDRDLFVRAASIIIENSLEALPEEGKLSICSEKEDDYCRISFSDTGYGIAAEDLPYIFNPLFSTKPHGIGMNLALVKRIMESHGGKVEVVSQPETGATFVLFLPLERRRALRTTRLQHENTT